MAISPPPTPPPKKNTPLFYAGKLYELTGMEKVNQMTALRFEVCVCVGGGWGGGGQVVSVASDIHGFPLGQDSGLQHV